MLVSLVGAGALVGDPAQPHVRLGDGRALLEAFGELEGLAPKLLRSLEVTLAHRQLAQAEQHQAAAASQVAVVAQLERAVQMESRLRQLTIGQHPADRVAADRAAPGQHPADRVAAGQRAAGQRGGVDLRPVAVAHRSDPVRLRHAPILPDRQPVSAGGSRGCTPRRFPPGRWSPGRKGQPP